jgi:hypothetical protein
MLPEIDSSDIHLFEKLKGALSEQEFDSAEQLLSAIRGR